MTSIQEIVLQLAPTTLTTTVTVPPVASLASLAEADSLTAASALVGGLSYAQVHEALSQEYKKMFEETAFLVSMASMEAKRPLVTPESLESHINGLSDDIEKKKKNKETLADALRFFAAVKRRLNSHTYVEFFEANTKASINRKATYRRERAFDKLVKKQQSSNKKLASAEVHLHDRELDLAKSKSINAMQDDTIDATKDKYARMAAELSAQHAGHIQTVAAAQEAENRQSEIDLQFAEEDHAISEANCQILQHHRDATFNQLHEATRACTTQLERIGELQTSVASANAEVGATDAQLAELRHNLVTCRMDLKYSRKELAATQANLETAVAYKELLQRTADSNAKNLAALKVATSHNSVRATARVSENELIQQNRADAKVIESLRAEVDQQSSKIGNLARGNQNLATTAEGLRSQVDMRTSEVASLKSATTKVIDDTKADLAKKTATYYALKKAFDDRASEHAAALKEKQEIVNSLEKTASKLTVKVKGVTRSLEYADGRMDETEKELNLLKEAVSAHEISETNNKAIIARLEKGYVQRKAFVEAASGQARLAESPLKSTNAKVKKMAMVSTTDFKNLQTELVDTASRLNLSYTEYDMLCMDHSQMVKECNILNRKLAAPAVCGCAAELKAMRSQCEVHARHLKYTATAAVNDLNTKIEHIEYELATKDHKLDVKKDMVARAIGKQLRCNAVTPRHLGQTKTRSKGVSKH